MYSITLYINCDLERPLKIAHASVYLVAYRLHLWLLRNSGASNCVKHALSAARTYKAGAASHVLSMPAQVEGNVSPVGSDCDGLTYWLSAGRDSAVVLAYDKLYNGWTVRYHHAVTDYTCYDAARVAFVGKVMQYVQYVRTDA